MALTVLCTISPRPACLPVQSLPFHQRQAAQPWKLVTDISVHDARAVRRAQGHPKSKATHPSLVCSSKQLGCWGMHAPPSPSGQRRALAWQGRAQQATLTRVWRCGLLGCSSAGQGSKQPCLPVACKLPASKQVSLLPCRGTQPSSPQHRNMVHLLAALPWPFAPADTQCEGNNGVMLFGRLQALR